MKFTGLKAIQLELKTLTESFTEKKKTNKIEKLKHGRRDHKEMQSLYPDWELLRD